MLTEGTKEMDFQPVLTTDVNIISDNTHQVLLVMGARPSVARGAKYLVVWGGCKAPGVPGEQSCARHPPTLMPDTHPLGWGGPRRVSAGLDCHNTGGIQGRGLQLLQRHIWPRLPKRLCVLLQRSPLPATVGLLVWK